MNLSLFNTANLFEAATNLKTPKLTDDIIDNQFKLKDIKDSNGLTYI